MTTVTPFQAPADYAPPVIQQPSSTVVVVNQQQQSQPNVQREWSTGLCACFDDVGNCFYVLCCPTCANLQLLGEAGESVCLPCFMPDWLVAIRTKIRTKFNIRGSILNDFFVSCMCGQCATCQLMREIRIARENGLTL